MCRKYVSLLLLLSFPFYLASCTSMRYVSPDDMSEVEQESSVWVTMADGSRYELKEPKVEDSKLVGYIEPEDYRQIEASEIESLGIKELDKTSTIALGVCGVAGAVILMYVLGNGGGACKPGGT
jgi:hypothetical protein